LGLFSLPSDADRLWGPPSLLSKGYWRSFPMRWSDGSVKLTTHLHLGARSKN